MDKDKRCSSQGRSLGKRKERQVPSAGLEIEAAFEKWLTFVREHLGCSYSWHGPFASDLERINAIDEETALLVKLAPEWNAETFYSAQIDPDADVTKGSEHYVKRYLEEASPRVVKATIPASMDGRSIPPAST